MIIVREAIGQDYPSVILLMKNELGYPELDDEEAVKRLENFSNSDDWETFVAVGWSDGSKTPSVLLKAVVQTM